MNNMLGDLLPLAIGIALSPLPVVAQILMLFGKRARSGDWMVEQAVHNWDVMNWANKGLPVRAMGLGKTGLYKSFQPDRDVPLGGRMY